MSCNETQESAFSSDVLRAATRRAHDTGASVPLMQLLAYLSDQCHNSVAWLQVGYLPLAVDF